MKSNSSASGQDEPQFIWALTLILFTGILDQIFMKEHTHETTRFPS